MNIGILGAGNIGGQLGRKLGAAGHNVLIGVRDPHSAKAQAAHGPNVRLGTLADAAAFGEVVAVALPLDAARTVLPALHLSPDTIVVDTTNAFGGLPDGYASAAAAIVGWSGSRRVIKAWNATPWEALADPLFQGQTVETFVCGDDAAAKAVVMQLVRESGFIAVDVGGLVNAPLTESFAKLWGTLAYQSGFGRDFAFKMLRRSPE